jgi:hypothetical protein
LEKVKERLSLIAYLREEGSSLVLITQDAEYASYYANSVKMQYPSDLFCGSTGRMENLPGTNVINQMVSKDVGRLTDSHLSRRDQRVLLID